MDIDRYNDDPHMKAIEAVYGDQCADRSGIPLMFHIREGLILLDFLEAPDVVGQAWCIHPVVQADNALLEELAEERLLHCDPLAIVLAMLYREIANSFLSPDYDTITLQETEALKAKLDKFPEIRLMLIADKIQNQKDFLRNESLYENRDTLRAYFEVWLFRILRLDADKYMALKRIIQ